MGVLGSITGPAGAHWRVDLALAAAVTTLTVAEAVIPEADATLDLRDGGATQVAVAATMGVALWWRRSAPLAVFSLSTALITTTALMQWPPGWQPVAWFIAAYAVGAHSPRPRNLVGLACGLAAVALLVLLKAPYFDSWLAVGTVGQLVVAWLLGVAMRRSRVDHETSRERIDSAGREALVAAEESARLERMRVARDLHDSVTNALSGVVVQAAALHRTCPGSAGPQLEAIESSGHGALVDLRRLLGALRAAPGAATPAPPESAPGPTPSAGAARGAGGASETPAMSSSRPRLQQQWSQWPVDLAFALAVAAMNVTGSVVADPFDPTPYREPVLPVLVVLAALPGLSLVLRRRWPAVPLVTAAGVMLLFEALLWQHGNLPATVLIAAFAVGAWHEPRRGALTIAAVAAVVVALTPTASAGQAQDDLWLIGPLLVLPWVLGLAMRSARLRARRAQERAEAAEERITALRRGAVADARLRVARDLHDLVVHRLAEIVVQTVTARRIAGPDLDVRLAAMEAEARGALEAMRSMLASLEPAGSPETSPAPGLASIKELVLRHRRLHGPVELVLDPTADEGGGDGVALTAYRVVQEAMANAARHAPGARLTVAVRDQGDAVEIVVEDDGRLRVAVGASAGTAGGLGLVGMAERVALAGGRVDAGPRDSGGFRVRAVLPRREGER